MPTRPSGFTDTVINEWHPTRNTVPFTSITAGSHDVAWWVDEHGHEWSTQIRSRSGENPTSCPYCSGKKLLSGFNDLASTHPLLAAQWHSGKNTEPASAVFSSSRQKAWWQDEHGHEWEAQIRSRVEGATCPYCSGRKLLPGFNDFATRHPELLAEWNDSNVDPTQVFSSSTASVSWKCAHGHEWVARVQSRTNKNNGCPYCAKKKVDPETTSIAVTHPELTDLWDNEMNTVTMEDVSLYSRHLCHWKCRNGHRWQSTARAVAGKSEPCTSCKHDSNELPELLAEEWDTTQNQLLPSGVNPQRSVWWKGTECGHVWKAKIAHRLNGSGCVYCSGYAVLEGFNDLATTHPALVKQWHPTKNLPLEATQVTAGSKQRVWWLDEYGHEWDTFVYSRARTSNSSGCPSCNNTVSKPETDLYEALTSLGLRVEKSDRKVLGGGKEIDLYIPDRKVGIEFNGLYWHSEDQGKDRNYHFGKFEAATQAGVQLIQIWEDDWRDRKEVVLRALAHKLGVTAGLAQTFPELKDVTTKVFARATKVALLATGDAQKFLEQNHIQGFASGTYYIGLKSSDGVLRALMVLKKEADEKLNIIRYATAGSVSGGFQKLLAYAERTYSPSSFITFADHTISDGGLYQNNGFLVDKIIPPDYMYVVNKQRKHKFGYRLKRFKNDPNLLWDETLSERELALLNNIPRIWDAGKTRYVREVQKSSDK
jgi:G:T-mismatch repair DNA endonuclease (very short patch repair protein)